MTECQHGDTELRRRVIRGGSVQIVHQCLSCGEPVGNPVAHWKVKGPTPDFDSDLQKRVSQARVDEYERQRRNKEGEWWDTYNAYLASPEWRRRRAAVLKRDAGMCQGCLAAPATEVHHLTYERVGRELLFDLVSLCEACHEIAHEEDK